MNVALIADWLPTYGGAEHVIAELKMLWPQAPIFTTVARHGRLGPLDRTDIRTSGLQKLYRILRRHELLLPWMPRAVERMDLRGFDVIVSSSHAVAKGVIPPSTAVHICYCHTPMRYAWEMEDEYLRDFRVPKILRRTAKQFLKSIRRWDLTTSKRVDVFIANSSTTQERITRTYGRESTVIRPPVGDSFFSHPLLSHEQKKYFLAIGRLVPYKRFDLLIETANRLALPLKIAGTGHDESRLRKLAGPTVEVLGYVPDDRLPSLYARAKAVLFPQVEDAGVVPLEAQACGTPVIALGIGGVRDTVQ
ncbi:MAG: glycosyltransferase, partial [Candidatus Peribacteraceae bacterium]|nr:glycosyltransferase [Candidatus Peribacteraceae bacterium]